MTMQSFVAYYRVSTQRQGASGLGLDAQRLVVSKYLSDRAQTAAGEFVEVETGKKGRMPWIGARSCAGRWNCASAWGATLLIAKLDRLARNVHFVSGLIETGVDFAAADMPNASKVIIQIHAVMSEWGRDQISERTKAALGGGEGARGGAGGYGTTEFAPAHPRSSAGSG